MNKPPKSKVAIALFLLAAIFACGCAFAIFKFVQMPGDTRVGTIAKISVLDAVRYSGLSALLAFVSGYVVQMIADIRWKLFEGETNA